MRRRTPFPKGSKVVLQVIGVLRVYRHPDGSQMTEQQADAFAQGYIPGHVESVRTSLASYGPTTSAHLWRIYCDDQRRNKWAIDYSYTERLWNGVEETQL